LPIYQVGKSLRLRPTVIGRRILRLIILLLKILLSGLTFIFVQYFLLMAIILLQILLSGLTLIFVQYKFLWLL